MTNMPIGVIEGFYGKPWTWRERREMVSFLKKQRAQFYIYAPKDEKVLREEWRSDWDARTFKELLRLRFFAFDQDIRFGLGLSVLGIESVPKRELLADLEHKMERLNRLAPDILCLLFDDMPGNFEDAAFLQSELVRCVRGWSNARKLIMCPTYYSSCAAMDRISGKKPAEYWEDLGKYLPREVDIFWTGPGICSAEYPFDGLDDIGERFQRKPFIWDNYPVNDGEDMADFLHLRSVHRPRELGEHISGLAINPMNEAFLSRIPISLAFAHLRGFQMDIERATEYVCGKEMGRMLLEDLPLLQDVGLSAMSDETKKEIRERYAAFLPHYGAREIVSWIDGVYHESYRK